jgi:hypothetical protein
VVGHGPIFEIPVIGVLFEPGYKEDPGFGPAGELPVVDIAPIHNQHAPFGKIQALSHHQLVDLSLGEMGIDGQITVVIQQ